ncbi:hypothetical protein IAT40_007790 [Kwoniella sp. CBS 6097]
MSAVVEALNDALRPSQSINVPPSKPPSPSHAQGSEQDKKETDVTSSHQASAAHPVAVENATTPSSENKAHSGTPGSDSTRIGTPRPDRSSTSSNARRVSIASARPLVATYTPGTRHRLVDGSNATPDDEHSNPSDSEDEDEPLVSPYQPIQVNTSLESKDTSTSANMTTDSTPADLQLGPQDLPFVLRRRAGAEVTSPASDRLEEDIPPFTPRFRNAMSSGITIRPDLNKPLTSTPATRPSNRMTLHTVTTSSQLSTWRLEQIKNARPAKLMGGTTLRPIPTLHGPLSLPYARNPSGVDATVADETAYMSHVFGLRAAPNITLGNPNIKVNRTVSAGTHSSGGTGSRSTSGSSGLLSTTGSSQDRSVLTEGSGYTSAGGTNHRPFVVRDPNQNIGIKLKGAPGKVGKAGTIIKESKDKDKKANEAPTVNPARAKQFSSDSQENKDDENKENIDPSSVQLKRRASETSLLEPKLGESVLGPSRSHVNLREMSNLSPIPGSPADVGGDKALQGTQLSAAAPSFHTMHQSGSMIPLRLEPSGGAIRLPSILPIYFNPATMSYEVGLAPPSRRSSYEDHHISTPGGVFLPPGTKGTPNHPSKADVSDNWRKKSDDATNDQQVRAGEGDNDPHTAVEPHAASQPAEEGAEATAGPNVMTIDNLFEKFTHTAPEDKEDAASPVAFNFPTPSNPAKRAVLKPSRSIPVSPRRAQITVLGENTKKLNAEAPPYTPSKSSRASKKKGPSPTPDKSKQKPSSRRASTSAKGTPGAGKLLKKVSTGDEEAEGETDDAVPVTPAPARKVEGKAKSKAGKK